jgi:hypothetical protein
MDNESKDLESKENSLQEKTPQQEAVEQMNEVAKEVVTNIHNDRNKAQELYDFMKDRIDIENDQSDGTRAGMSKALELQMKGSDQLIDLLKIKAKMINPNKGTNININLGDYDEKKGTDTNNMIDIVERLNSSN